MFVIYEIYGLFQLSPEPL